MPEILPAQPHTSLIYPYLGDGFTSSGIYVAFDDRLPPVLGLVLVPHPTSNLRYGQTVIFRPYAFDTATTTLGEIAVIHDNAVAGIIED